MLKQKKNTTLEKHYLKKTENNKGNHSQKWQIKFDENDRFRLTTKPC